jgi:transposase
MYKLLKLFISTRYSLLLALTCEGIVYCDIKAGAYDGPSFTLYVENLLQHMNPWPEPQSVLVTDNCPIHHVDEVRYLCDEQCIFNSFGTLILELCFRGVRLRYLPPYSPDLNPIEEAFGYIKSYLRRHGDTFRAVLHSDNQIAIYAQLYAALGTITAEKARGWMHHSGYW